MNTLVKYAPSFYGKDATERLDSWNTLLLANDFAALLESHKMELVGYIAALRKAEIFEKCAEATDELKHLKEFLSWDEDYSVDYHILTSLSYYCDDVDQFIAHSSREEFAKKSWVIYEFHQSGGGNSLDWEVRDYYGEKNPGDVHIRSLSLVDSPVTKSTPSVSLAAG